MIDEIDPFLTQASAARPDTAQVDTAAIRAKHGCIHDPLCTDGNCNHLAECYWCETRQPCEANRAAAEVDSLRAQLSAAQAASREMAYEEQLWAQRVRKAEVAIRRVLDLCDDGCGPEYVEGESYEADGYMDALAKVRAALDQPDERPAKDGA